MISINVLQYIVVRTYYSTDSPGKENLLGFDDIAAWTVATISLVNTSFFLSQMCHTSDLGPKNICSFHVHHPKPICLGSLD